MKRLARMAMVALPLMTLAAAPAYAEVKTRDKTQVKFEGMLGRMFNLFGGKGAKEGVEGRTAVKGNRKATLSDSGGTIVDLTEEKLYELDAKKKQYTVTTFEELRRRMREAQEKAKQQAEKDKGEPAQKEDPQKPTKEYEVDFDVKETGQKKQLAGYDAHNTIVTITVREKGQTLDEAGGIVMTNDLWLGPSIPQLKELYEFDIKYAKQLQGPGAAAMSAEQMAAMVAMFPLISKATERMQKDAGKLAGTPLETTTTFESVRSKDQLTQAQESSSKSSGGGISGMLAKKIMKQEPPKARSTIVTSHHEVLEVATAVAATDLAIPADYKEKKQ
ncbi:MAG: hypothetical protein ABIQ52_01090 [Vicinamibacterales bacterium]